MTRVWNVKEEVSKCHQCGLCDKCCPVGISPKVMIGMYKAGEYENLINYIYDKNPFGEICGYICPNKFCVNRCTSMRIGKGVNISGLQRHFCEDYRDMIRPNFSPFNGKTVAVVGAGIAGMTASWWLAKKGFNVELFEKEDKMGGELNLIPKERLPKEVIQRDFDRILKTGRICLHLGEAFDRVGEFETVFYCIGSKPNKLEIEGIENAIYYDEYLKQQTYKMEEVAIIGGGNVAYDCACHNFGHSTLFVRRNYWDMKIDDVDFMNLVYRHISVVPTFTPEKIGDDMTLYGTFDGNKYSKKFDKIVIAIGRIPLLAQYEKPINVLTPADSVVETIASTIKQLEEYYNEL